MGGRTAEEEPFARIDMQPENFERVLAETGLEKQSPAAMLEIFLEESEKKLSLEMLSYFPFVLYNFEYIKKPPQNSYSVDQAYCKIAI